LFSSQYCYTQAPCRNCIVQNATHSTGRKHVALACRDFKWLLSRIQVGYRLQFEREPPGFSMIRHSKVQVETANILRQEINSQRSNSGDIGRGIKEGIIQSVFSYSKEIRRYSGPQMLTQYWHKNSCLILFRGVTGSP